MRYPASEKLEIIHLVEQSHLSAKRTLDTLGCCSAWNIDPLLGVIGVQN